MTMMGAGGDGNGDYWFAHDVFILLRRDISTVLWFNEIYLCVYSWINVYLASILTVKIMSANLSCTIG